jgi:hypothetical protein
MTRRSSVRAQARRNYCDLVAGQRKSAPTPAPSPRVARARGGGEQRRVETKLTKRVRRLYEDSAVPVREIARIVGVTERTIYKYVEKHGWQKRYRVVARVVEAVRGDCAPVTGAGGRFIRREDKDKPVAVGLKATDPAGASRAVASSGQAARLSAEALASAEFWRWQGVSLRALTFAVDALEKHVNYRTKHGITGNRPSGVDVLDDALLLSSEMAREAMDAAAKERAAAFQAWMALPR